jgi:hypothetical protein
MENTSTNSGGKPAIVLSKKEKTLEMLAIGLCALVLLASFLKVMFF